MSKVDAYFKNWAKWVVRSDTVELSILQSGSQLDWSKPDKSYLYAKTSGVPVVSFIEPLVDRFVHALRTSNPQQHHAIISEYLHRGNRALDHKRNLHQVQRKLQKHLAMEIRRINKTTAYKKLFSRPAKI